MIEKLEFGRSGHASSRIIFGGAALYRANEKFAGRALELLLENGVNHLDLAASYGEAESWVGGWMREHRGDFFLASKTGERAFEPARESICRSLERLKTDHLDLIQFHNLAEAEESAQALGEGGALEAALEAREAGLVRYIGITGHGSEIAARHLKNLDAFAFDSVLLPYNYGMMSQPQYAADFEALLDVCKERGTAVQTIKSIARRRRNPGEPAETRTWYVAYSDEDDIRRAVHWALQRPGIFVNSASDLNLLPLVLKAARSFDAEAAADANAAMRELALRDNETPLFTPGRDAVNLESETARQATDTGSA